MQVLGALYLHLSRQSDLPTYRQVWVSNPRPPDFAPTGSFTEVDYRYVLASLVSYLRDHDCWVCLACLLAAATARGVVLLSAPGGDVLGAGDLSPGAELLWNCVICYGHSVMIAGDLYPGAGLLTRCPV